MNSKKTALMFPGQGSQVPGMGKSLYEKFPAARDILDRANDVLGFDLRKILFTGTEEELKQTQITQPAIFAVSCAAFKALETECPDLVNLASHAAGHSLGEYSALFSAGVFDFETGLKLVQSRGRFIQECCEKHPGTMAAILGIKKPDLESLCASVSADQGVCEPVNFNTADQTVVAGTRSAVEALLAKVAAVPGAKGIALSVSGAFHSSLMKEAAEKMRETLKNAVFADARMPVLTNCDAAPTLRAQDFKDKLARQIDHPVRWEESIRRILSDDVGVFVELGPGKVLTGILRKIERRKKALNVEDEASLSKTKEEWNALVSVSI